MTSIAIESEYFHICKLYVSKYMFGCTSPILAKDEDICRTKGKRKAQQLSMRIALPTNCIHTENNSSQADHSASQSSELDHCYSRLSSSHHTHPESNHMLGGLRTTLGELFWNSSRANELQNMKLEKKSFHYLQKQRACCSDQGEVYAIPYVA